MNQKKLDKKLKQIQFLSYKRLLIDLPNRNYEAGIRYERQRIIEIIESLNCEANGIEHDCDPLGYYSTQDLIQLIKGEGKRIEL